MNTFPKEVPQSHVYCWTVIYHDDVIKWKHFPRYHGYWPLCVEFTGHRWIPNTKASDAELWCFFIRTWTNSWANNGDAGDFRRHHAHVDVSVILTQLSNRMIYLFGPILWECLNRLALCMHWHMKFPTMCGVHDRDVLQKAHKSHHSPGWVLANNIFLPAVKDQLSSETTPFSVCFIRVPLHFTKWLQVQCAMGL